MIRDSKFIAVYDISDDRERDKVENALKNYGFRIQKSVFECRLTKRGITKLCNEISKLSIQTGFTRIYRIQHNTTPIDIGNKPYEDFDSGPAFII